jgi:hypothetical protein
MLKILEHEVAFLQNACRAARLPHAQEWKLCTLTNKLCTNLASAPAGTGHDKFLAGIAVFVVIEASHVWWPQFWEYHFRWKVSSSSKMHSHPGATEEELEQLSLGYPLTQAHVVNYLTLKTIYQQRKHHRLGSWETFCEWIRTLPRSEWITQEPQI